MAEPRRKTTEKPAVPDIKSEAHRLVDNLPDGATWNDLLYALHVRMSIEDGRKAAREGRVISQDEIEKLFGITR